VDLDGPATHISVRAAPPMERRELVHYLVMTEGGQPGRRILLERATLTIGRDPSRDVVLSDPDISRLHACLWVSDGQVMVEDQSSTNGTFIDGHRIAGPAVLGVGSLLGLGHHVLKLERRSRREVERAEQIQRDLERASHYVQSLLPAPLVDGPIRTDWQFHPSAQLGGDAFGYDRLDADTFAMYLLDVSGHGAGAAMHSVSVMSVLRQRALPDADLREPAQVLASLNAMFQMDRHDGLFFTMWYGVYHATHRTLRYACGGHHPGYLVAGGPAGATAMPLKTRGLMVGATPEARYRVGEATVPQGSALYMFSDGVFEIMATDRQWRLADFIPLLTDRHDDDAGCLPESTRLYNAVRAAARRGPLDDDFSLVVVTFA